MTVQAKQLTVEEFDRFIELPENIGRRFEFVGGRLVENPWTLVSADAKSRILVYINSYVRQNDLGYTTSVKLGQDGGGFIVSGERYIPDAEFISKKRQPEQIFDRFNPLSPDLVVEFDLPVAIDVPTQAIIPSSIPFQVDISPNSYDEYERNLRIKIFNYLAAGTVVWVIVPEVKEIEVYTPGKPAKILNMTDILDGGDVLPGFKLTIKSLFPDLAKE